MDIFGKTLWTDQDDKELANIKSVFEQTGYNKDMVFVKADVLMIKAIRDMDATGRVLARINIFIAVGLFLLAAIELFNHS